MVVELVATVVVVVVAVVANYLLFSCYSYSSSLYFF